MREEDEMIIPADESVENTNGNEVVESIEETVEAPTFMEDVEDESDTTGDAQDSEDTTDSGSGSDTSEVVIEEPKPEPVVEVKEEVTDPGEFQPKDYSYDITLADGSVIKISKPEDIKNIPADASFESPQALFEAGAKYTQMVNGIEADKREYDANKEKFESDKENKEAVEKRIETAIAEMNYLETKGRLPKYDAKYDTQNWNDPEVAKQPGIKERLELINYRAKENEQRQALGLGEMSLIEAQMQMAQEARESREVEVKNKQAEARKKRGSMVGGNTSSELSDGSEDDMIIGEGGSIRDIR